MLIKTKYNLGNKLWVIREKKLAFQISDPRSGKYEVAKERVTVRSIEVIKSQSDCELPTHRVWYLCTSKGTPDGEYINEKDLFSTRQFAEKAVVSRNKLNRA